MSKPQWRPDLLTMAAAQAELTKKYLTLKHEQAYIQFEDGRIAKFQGGQHGIELEHIIKLLKNAHIIHNHPQQINFFECKGLSGHDIGFVVNTNMSTMAVLDEGQGIRISRPNEGWPNTDSMLQFIPNKLTWEDWGKVELWTT